MPPKTAAEKRREAKEKEAAKAAEADTDETEEEPQPDTDTDDAPDEMEEIPVEDASADPDPHKPDSGGFASVLAASDDTEHDTRAWYRVTATNGIGLPLVSPESVKHYYSNNDLVLLSPEESQWLYAHGRIVRAHPSREEIADAQKSQPHLEAADD